MTKHSTQETIHTLERLQAAGRYDAARDAINANSPVLAELGVSSQEALSALNTSPGQLETVGMEGGLLEAIVRATGRPPLIVRGGVVEGTQSLGKDFPANVDGLILAVEPLLASIGRIEFLNHDMVWGGTGWVIADEGDKGLLIVTNRHVARLVARRTHRGDGVYMFGDNNVQFGAHLDTGEEVGAQPDPARVLPIARFTYLADDAAADVALGRVLPLSGRAAFRPLDLAAKDGGDKELVAVVGYPASDAQRNDPGTMQSYFKGLYEVKRFSPGFLRVSPGPTILGHDCTTLGGNSGSPVISLISGKVVGLHFAGEFGIGNSAVRASTLRALLDEGAGGGVVVPPQPPLALPPDPERFAGRGGYDPDFLRTEPVPLPVVPGHYGLSSPTDALADRPFELRYRNFSILHSGQHKTPIIAALNIDGAQTRAVKSRARWRKDPRLPDAAQLGEADYADPEIDRGHMVRREATNWGSQDQAEQADDDSFHYSVASPQHQGFNRSPATWLGIEDYVLRNTRTHGFRCNVFAGPILTGDEPPLGDSGAVVPLAYFKVVSMLAEDDSGALRLHATGYVLSQGQLIAQWLTDLGRTEATEGFVFGAFKTFQVRISDIEAETGHDFGALRRADPLAEAATESPGSAPFRTLDRLEDILL